MENRILKLNLRSRVQSSDGIWKEVVESKDFRVDEVAILLCDVWDNHWCSGAKKRVDNLAPRISQIVSIARENGVQIIHSPSGTIDFYRESIYRKKILEVPKVEPVELFSYYEPPLPIDDSDGGCDSGEKPWYKAWTREHPAIEIKGNDVISDDGVEIYSFLKYLNVDTLIYIGFHTNMCILNRPFGIRKMKRYGIGCILVRDLTDAMYNPSMYPYVSHEEGTELVIQHIEKYLCPTILSKDLESVLEVG